MSTPSFRDSEHLHTCCACLRSDVTSEVGLLFFSRRIHLWSKAVYCARFFRFKNGPLLPLLFFNCIVECRILCAAVCKNKHFTFFVLYGDHTYNVSGTGTSRYLCTRYLFERSEFLIATCEKKNVCVCVCSANRQNTVYLCLSTYIVFENTHAHRNCGQTHIYQVHDTCTGICTSSMYDTITYVQL